jgi:hypothetical protein
MTPIRNSIRFGNLGAGIVFGPNAKLTDDEERDNDARSGTRG